MKKTDKETMSSFWDLEALIPKKKQAPTPPRRNIDAVDVFSDVRETGDGDTSDASPGETNAILPKKEIKTAVARQEPERVWEPEEGLVRRVEIYSIPQGYPVYEQFRRDAAKLYHIKGLPCSKEPFFSFVPQYSQLTRAQLNTYFYWREEVRSGRYPTVDFSYLKLYLFELINLSDVLPEPEFFRRMTEVYREYREVFSQLDSMVPEWLADYCLLHGILPPDTLSSELPVIERVCSVKELFIRRHPEDKREDARVLLGFCSAYDYRGSRYAEGKLRSMMDEHIPGALAEVLLSGVSGVLSAGPVRMTMERQTFTRAICVQSLKKRVKITYDALSHSFEMKALIGEIVKYSENRLRAAAGIKSRLTVRSLPEEVKRVLDGYFDVRFPKKQHTNRKEDGAETESYWKYYDAEKTSLSPELAGEIERESWRTTEKLVETFAEQPTAGAGTGSATSVVPPTEAKAFLSAAPAAEPVPVPQNSDSATSAPDVTAPFLEKVTVTGTAPMPEMKSVTEIKSAPGMTPTAATPGSGAPEDFAGNRTDCPFSGEELAYLSEVLSGNSASQLVSRLPEPLDAFVDRINEKAVERFGDILLEESDDGYALIPDYTTMTEELIKQYGKSE